MKPVKVRVPIKVQVDVQTTTTSGTQKKRPKRREMKPEQAAGFAKKEAYRKLRERKFGDRF